MAGNAAQYDRLCTARLPSLGGRKTERRQLGRIDRLTSAGLDLGGLDTTFGFLLHAAWRDALRTFGDHFAETGITPLTYSILLLLHRNPGCAPGDLSEVMGVTSNNMTRLLDELIARKLVERSVRATDRRARTLRLTAEGETMIAELRARHRRYEAAVNDRIGAERIERLCEILRHFD
jgi:DNA-binding MarR family transcriptional regulator